MRAYKEYKDSGYDWLGKIPAHWRCVKIREIFIERRNKVSDKDFPPLSVTKAGIVPQLETAAKSDDGDNRKRVNVGDFVINGRSDRKGSSGISPLEGSVSLINHVLIPRLGVNKAFLHYLLRSNFFIEEFYKNGRGIVADLWTTRYSDMKTIRLPLPPREEQDAIVRFLDAKCAKIDSFIKLKERQIALLNEKKQNIINQAVTKGLDPNAPMKDSGVDWIGEIPEGWEVLRCKYLFTETNVRSEKGEETHLSMSQKYGLVPDSMMEEKRMLSESYAGGKLCCKDDIVLNRLKAHLGVFALASQDGVVSPDYTVLSINKNRIFSHYAECILKSYSCRRELVIRVRGIVNGFLRLYTEDFNTIKLPLPTIDEQKRIMEFVSKIERIIKTKIDILENNILLMNEYRQRLISDVVTGKINILEGNSDV